MPATHIQAIPTRVIHGSTPRSRRMCVIGTASGMAIAANSVYAPTVNSSAVEAYSSCSSRGAPTKCRPRPWFTSRATVRLTRIPTSVTMSMMPYWCGEKRCARIGNRISPMPWLTTAETPYTALSASSLRITTATLAFPRVGLSARRRDIVRPVASGLPDSDTAVRASLGASWDLGMLPFQVGHRPTASNAPLPDVLPFVAAVETAGGLIVQRPHGEVSKALEDAYRRGSQIGTPLCGEGMGSAQLDDVFEFIVQSLPAGGLEGS